MKKFFATMLIAACALPAFSQTIYKNKGYEWKKSEIVQGKFHGKAVSPVKVTSDYEPIPPKMTVWNDMNPAEINRREWNLTKDISHLPQYESSNVLDNALYNMALEESVLAIEPDSTFRTGIAWGGVWTRDISYSIIHSLAQLHPEVCMKSLCAKVNANNRIIQDTGTGGAWPCSTDRVIWAVAAWEVYKVTGDRNWLTFIYPVIRNTLMDDIVVAYDAKTGLMRGETSYMDWREQEYPTWMEPADIYSSEAVVNNAVHYMAIKVLADICGELNLVDEAAFWNNRAASLSAAINRNLWLEDKGYYAIYLYGRRYPILSEQCDAMGSALAILSGIANEERTRSLSENQVSEPFGTPCIYPNLKDQYPYHNDATWPFVQGYWLRAQAKAGNEEGVLHGIGALYRGAALWLSNEENYEISTGDYQLTKLNSPRQLWSVAAQAAVVPHIYFGIEYFADRLEFHPFVPKTLKGHRVLRNFKYRGATLNITLDGFGNDVAECLIDGMPSAPVVLGNVTGTHDVTIKLTDKQPAKMQITLLDNAYLPITPKVTLNGKTLSWQPTEGSVKYELIRNGVVVNVVTGTSVDLTESGEYAVRGISEDGTPGYICEPVDYHYGEIICQVEDFAPAASVALTASSASDASVSEATAAPVYVEITRNENVCIVLDVNVPEEGDYSIDWRYANGNGPISTENKCAIRLMSIDGKTLPVLFPHRGTDEWDNWGFSNKHTVHLKPGKHTVKLTFEDTTENMNLVVNAARIDYLRLVKL